MNRGEQENLYRQSRNLRLQQQEAKAHQQQQQQQQQQLQHAQHQQLGKRHYSYGNIHQFSGATVALPPIMIARGLGSFAMDDQQLRQAGPACDDLVLSVLKSPVKETTSLLTGSRSALSASPSAGSNGITMGGGGGGSTQTQTPSPCATGGVSPGGGMISYRTLQGSEDDLVDDVESAIETTELNAGDPHRAPLHPGGACASSSPRALKFLRRFRPGKPARAFEPHHKRVPTPMRRKNRSRSRSRSNDILDGVGASQGNIVVDDDDDDDVDMDEDVHELPGVGGMGGGIGGGGVGGGGEAGGGASGGGGGKNLGVPNPYYPIALPIDQAFKAKYVFHHRRGKTVQERFYVFLEHPGGWLCFVYHFSV
uniref:Uncharacterized protein n=1 Tax=Anopheles epiroticus TaxID=199890 RepID=A0A182PCD9_9DIPT